MKIEFVLDCKDFHEIGMGEATFDFNDIKALKSEDFALSFSIWGLEFDSNFLSNITKKSNLDISEFLSEDIVVAGWTKISFSNPKLLLCNGLSLRLEQNENEPFCFVLGGVAGNQFIEFDVLADKQVTLTFNTDDFVSAKEFVTNPSKYTYKG
jgi:hypothetical protein